MSKFFSPKLSRCFSRPANFKDSGSANCVDKVCLIFLEFSAPGACPLCGTVGNDIKKCPLEKA